ncbi:MAG: hypothetical protein P8P74_18410 [Crocinitomicaceae bacterium]|nr:hypothetical protein [Crocinitomicaceae bacterium]
MKHLLSLAALFLALNLTAQSSSNPGEYMDYFSSEYLQIQEDMWDYTRSVSHGKSARKVEKRRSELIQTTSSAKNKAKRAKGFKEDVRYRDSVVMYFELIEIVLKEDYAKIVDMEAIAEQSYDAMEAYMMARDLASDKMKEAGEMINREHRKFAEDNGITIIEGEDTKLDQKMEIANQVYDHYNEIYLIFFKSYKQELYLMEAIDRNDINAIEQNRDALLSTVEEGMGKLKEVKLYQGDKSMIEATRNLLKFYQKEAGEGIDVILEFFEANESFAKIKEAFEAKKEKNRTQEDVDTFNAAVEKVNKAVNDYNSGNETANKERGEKIDNWNKAAEKFTSKHVPRGK